VVKRRKAAKLKTTIDLQNIFIIIPP